MNKKVCDHQANETDRVYFTQLVAQNVSAFDEVFDCTAVYATKVSPARVLQQMHSVFE